MHKGYTQFSWALYSVSQGDDIVLVVQDKAYKLQGDKDELLKFMSSKVDVYKRQDLYRPDRRFHDLLQRAGIA